ncbi:3-deoxy-manno-octulosonate cytidylyltransferase [Legionella oakridgensis]|uniref:3-deoxy-manno-octulosonate cytidylyltransferase n=2 Tax=Legionella oakridgensis TaxID=29423 RepID=W0BCQ0_9GAMM|nr:3-deoxy-manno-octulosonate cytidylyltransferase [Legionella oakridgensis]AHE66476.1 3-deoxy-D-manno-octulosonate cytidylyltransferase [Legionella oakridgensis ATCC 33761 = DSM 21215]ETO93747.1 3-deoxy-D-manno-octulosonate cytidylyltransferase [Legionella oakridgensis RV-2-2007]KTD43953.1 3-deoxy-manno-octulosonate cytidylyltransferase [Legionella oakridgensis]STY19642.1 3-deoxy-manno-octulosonate cytidylyltransferase [Legionella longbeachae]
MNKDFYVIIPARYQSSRFPGKLLMELQGMTVIERVYRQALKANPKKVIIATDHQGLFEHARGFGADVRMTAASHQSGTDRIAEVVAKEAFAADDIIVNVQGDEPLIAPALITQVAECLAAVDTPMATLCWPIKDIATRDNPNVVKVVRDCNHHALYFSRSAIPAHREAFDDCRLVFRHIGLYAYRASFLLDVVRWPLCELEALEALEQLRVLWSGHKIKVEEACVPPLQDINTTEDLAEACRQLATE